jgi:chlorite dismutase
MTRTAFHYQLALRLFKNILSNNPDYKEPNLQSWANDVRLMMERDNRTEEQISYLMDWVQNDSFWKTNILSVSKLREKYDQLVMRVKENMNKQNKMVEKQLPKAYQSLQDWADENES